MRTVTRRRAATITFTLLALVAGACSSKDETEDAAPVADGDAPSTTEAAPAEDVLGAPNAATDTPIAIGFVHDGQSAGVDTTSQAETMEATVQYVNEYLGGINGHPIELRICETGNTPTGATNCGIEMVDAGVAAVLTGVSGQDAALSTPIREAGIPFFTRVSVTPDILLQPGAFILQNPLASLGAAVSIARENDIDHAAIVVIDVPAAAATGGIANPVFENAGIALDVILISPQIADLTPQIQQAISSGVGMFNLAGTEEFVANAVRAIKALNFDGEVIVTVSNTDPELIATIPGGYEGLTNTTATTDDPADPDVQIYDAVMATYAPDTVRNSGSTDAYSVLVSFVRALTGSPEAVDAPSVLEAISTMEPTPLALGGGIEFQCGAALVALTPNVCTIEILRGTIDEQGNGTGDYELLDVSEFLDLG